MSLGFNPDKPAAIACVPLGITEVEGRPYPPTGDYQVIPCDGCNRRVWIGPRSRLIRELEGLKAFCPICIAILSGGDGFDLTSLGGP